MFYEYCIKCNRQEQEFWNSSLSKVLYVIEKNIEDELEYKNFKIALFRSLGSNIPFIHTKEKEKDVYADSFDDLL